MQSVSLINVAPYVAPYPERNGCESEHGRCIVCEGAYSLGLCRLQIDIANFTNSAFEARPYEHVGVCRMDSKELS